MMTPYKVVKLAEAQVLTKDCIRLYLDTETCKLYGKIRLLQIYHESLKEVLLVEWPDPFLMAVWLDKRPHVWHNAHYDITVIQKHSRTKFIPKFYEDTFLLSRLHYSSAKAFSLDACLEYTLKFDPYKDIGLDKKAMQKANWDQKVLPPEFLVYAAIDVYYMPQLYEAVKNKESSISYKLDKLTLDYCLEFQHNGIPTDQARINARRVTNKRIIKNLQLPINAGSWQQVRKWLDVEESDDLALARIALSPGPKAMKARDIRISRKLEKQISFLDKWEADRIYGYFKPSARSGRLTSNEQNLQQIPRLLKGMFTAPDGRVFIRADFSQLELRGACAIVGERKMEDVLRAKGDLHNFTAERLFGKGFTKLQRQIAKTANFNLLYGGSARMLGSILLKDADLILPDNQLRLHRRRWQNLYTDIHRWQDSRTSDWQNGRLGSTPFGREYVGKLMTDQMNIEVQGFGAEVAKLSLHYKYAKIKDFGGDAILCNFVHDDYLVECDDDPEAYKGIALIIASAMQESWEEASATLAITDLPMPVDVNVGTNLGDMEAGENIIYTLQLE